MPYAGALIAICNQRTFRHYRPVVVQGALGYAPVMIAFNSHRIVIAL